MRAYGYLRASTKEQDATRAHAELVQFAEANGLPLVKCFSEHESGASLERPQLFDLLSITMAGDIILLEQIDRLTRLNSDDWQTLSTILKQKKIRIVSLDLPTSHQLINSGDEFTDRMMCALNSMMLDMLAAMARKDYQDRRRRQAQGISKAQKEGVKFGRPRDHDRDVTVKEMLDRGDSPTEIAKCLGIGRATVYRVRDKYQS